MSLVAGALVGALFVSGASDLFGNAGPDFGFSGVDTVGRFSVGTTTMLGRPDGEVMFVWDHERQKLALYRLTPKALELLHVRNCQYDFRPDEFNAAGRVSLPTVAKMRNP